MYSVLHRSVRSILSFSSVVTFGALLGLSSCKDVGFRELPEAEYGASHGEARELMSRVRAGLEAYKERSGDYPVISEEFLYDSIRNLLDKPLESEYLYRNDGRGYYLAVGGRTSRLVYHYPATIGSAEYTLYWVGANGVDEKGEGDDLPGWSTVDGAPSAFERRRTVDFRGDGTTFVLTLRKSGNDMYNDSALFTIREDDSVHYIDAWPINQYFALRPEMTDEERKRMVHDEMESFLDLNQFIHTDSILMHDWVEWADLDPKSLEAQEIVKANGLMFNYYRGIGGSRGLAWSPIRKKIITVWQSDPKKVLPLAKRAKRAESSETS